MKQTTLKKNLYYKWCRVTTDGKYKSIHAPLTSFKLEYKLGKITHPLKDSLGLFVFNSAKVAMQHKPFYNRQVLLACRVQGPALMVRNVIDLHAYARYVSTEPEFVNSIKEMRRLASLVFNKQVNRQRRIVEINNHKFISHVMLHACNSVYSVALVKPVRVVFEVDILKEEV